MRAVDTNVLVRLVTRDDAKQGDRRRGLRGPRSLGTTPGARGSDMGADVGLRSGTVRIANAIEMLLNHQHLTLQDSDAVTSASASFRKRPALGFSDCLVLEVARKAGHLPLGTFDRDLGKLAGAERL